MSEQTDGALNYLRQSCQDYAATMPPSVRGPFSRESSEALRILKEALAAPPAAPPKATSTD